MMRTVTVVLAVAVAASSCASIWHPRAVASPRRADAIVVLGNRPPVTSDGHVAPETASRVRRGVTLWRRRVAPVIVMTGGRAPSGHVEADVMRDLAMTLGVPERAIERERASEDTIDNARGTVALLCRGRPRPCHPRLVVVTSPYHLARAGELFACAGADVQLASADVPYTTGAVVREHLVRIYYALFIDACDRARGRARRPRLLDVLSAPIRRPSAARAALRA